MEEPRYNLIPWLTRPFQETEKQNNYYVVNQFQANVPFRHPLKTAEILMFFSMCPWGKERKHWPKMG